MIYLDFICAILGEFEGKRILRGYIPCSQGAWYPGEGDKGKILGVSGVTIATGVDLGQQSETGLRNMAVSGNLIEKLRPYLKAQAQDARTLLLSKPLALTEGEAKELDDAVHAEYIKETAILFGLQNFEFSPKEAQAVAVSLHYQFGTPKRAASPGLEKGWNAMQSGLYQEAASCLRDRGLWCLEHQPYMRRREREAALLERIAHERL
jgi:hypothetical protein